MSIACSMSHEYSHGASMEHLYACSMSIAPKPTPKPTPKPSHKLHEYSAMYSAMENIDSAVKLNSLFSFAVMKCHNIDQSRTSCS